MTHTSNQSEAKTPSNKTLSLSTGQLVETLRAAVSRHDWYMVEALWPILPVDFRTSNQGKELRGAMLEAQGDYEAAGKVRYDLYKETGAAHHLSRAVSSFIRATNWSLAVGVLNYFIEQHRYRSALSELADTLYRQLHIEDLYLFHMRGVGQLPLPLQPWVDPSTLAFRRAYLKVAECLMRNEPSPEQIRFFAGVAVALQLQVEASVCLESLDTPSLGAKWLYLANLLSAQGDEVAAREAYRKARSSDSVLPEIVPELSQSDVPFVLLHRGKADFVEFALRSIRHHHPDRRIILLADDHHRYDPALKIEYRQWAHYAAEASKLVKAYKHRSVNPFAFELLCLERWFVLEAFCESECIDRVIHLDTDVIVFDSFDELEVLWDSHRGALCGISPHVALMTREGIGDMTRIIRGFYEGTFEFSDSTGTQNISDMNFLGYLGKVTGWKDLLTWQGESAVDHHVKCADGCRMKDDFKDVTFHDGHAFGVSATTGEQIRFKSLHFQGSSKKRMKHSFEQAFGALESE